MKKIGRQASLAEWRIFIEESQEEYHAARASHNLTVRRNPFHDDPYIRITGAHQSVAFSESATSDSSPAPQTHPVGSSISWGRSRWGRTGKLHHRAVIWRRPDHLLLTSCRSNPQIVC